MTNITTNASICLSMQYDAYFSKSARLADASGWGSSIPTRNRTVKEKVKWDETCFIQCLMVQNVVVNGAFTHRHDHAVVPTPL